MTPKKVKVGTKEVTDDKKTEDPNAVKANQEVNPSNGTADQNVVF